MRNKIIFSVFRTNKEDRTNRINHSHVVDDLIQQGLNPTTALGSYKGETELSIVLDYEHIETAYNIARKFNQESVLMIDDSGKGWLIYMDRSKPIEYLGDWAMVKDINNLDAYTIIDGQAFTCA